MSDRKEEIAWLERIERDLRQKTDLCDCGRGPKKAETEMCQHCEDDAQANVVDLASERVVKVTEGER